MSILVKSSWVKELGPNLAVLYGLIVSVSDKYGLSFKTNKYLSSTLGYGNVTIVRRLKILVDKRWISRKTDYTQSQPEGRIISIRTISINP